MMISPIGISERSYAYKVPVAIEGDNGSSTVSIELDDPEITNLSTSANATEVAYISKGFTVTASNDYNIYVQTSNNSSDLTNGNFALRSISGSNVAPAGFSDNTWGYTVADNAPIASTLTYNAIPTSTTSAIKSGNDATGGKQFTLVFAAKFGNDATAGHYKTDVILSVAANPGEVTSGLSDVMYMQDLTPALCKSSQENESRIMMDTRDWKAYWVTKLKDGNCWMTQNLDYDDPNSTKVSAPSAWTSTDANYRAYYDPGNYYYTTPSNWTACSNNGTGLSACTSNGWSTSGDAHYHAGNYYSWQSATNGTGSSATSAGATASGSICPAGWQLPTSNANVKGSFGASLSTSAATGASLSGAYGLTNNAAGATILRNSPLYFIPGGYVGSGGLISAGNFGYYWSSTASDSTYAYYLYFASSNVNLSGFNNRYAGASVRCLVQGS